MSREKTAVRPAYGKNEKRERLMGYILAAPAVILLVVFTVYPLIYLIYRSLFGGNLIAKDPDFVGIENYQTLFESEDFHKVLTNTLVYTLITVVLGLVLGLVHEITLEPIAAQERRKQQEAYAEVLPDAESFEELDLSSDGRSEKFAEAIS